MNRSLLIDTTVHASGASQEGRLLRGYAFVNACAHTLIGIAMLILVFFTSSGVIVKGIEGVLSLAVIAASGMMWRELLNKQRQSAGAVLLAGEIALAAVFLYLGVSMPAFHQGQASQTVALAQFVTVLTGLIFGAGALALSGAAKSARPLGQVKFPDMVRDGVTLIIGTVLLAIAFGQISGAALKPPQWSWVSFLGITIPGMLILVGREGLKERFEHWQGPARFPRMLITDVLLIIGLSIMLYGSYANLTLGANGYQVGIKGNATGFMFWILAAFLLLAIRGAFKMAFSQRYNNVGYRVISKFLYVAVMVLFIYGARSVFTGNAPLFHAGRAAPAVALILVGAFLVLVIGRAVSQKVSA